MLTTAIISLNKQFPFFLHSSFSLIILHPPSNLFHMLPQTAKASALHSYIYFFQCCRLHGCVLWYCWKKIQRTEEQNKHTAFNIFIICHHIKINAVLVLVLVASKYLWFFSVIIIKYKNIMPYLELLITHSWIITHNIKCIYEFNLSKMSN